MTPERDDGLVVFVAEIDWHAPGDRQKMELLARDESDAMAIAEWNFRKRFTANCVIDDIIIFKAPLGEKR